MRSGYIFPFALRAVWITITDREFQVSPGGDVVAYLVQRQYVRDHPADPDLRGHEPRAVRRPTQPAADDHRQDASPRRRRDGPGMIVPDVGAPIRPSGCASAGQTCPSPFVGVDWEGRKVDFSAGVIWVDPTTPSTTQRAGPFTTPMATEYSGAANLSPAPVRPGRPSCWRSPTSPAPSPARRPSMWRSLEFGGQTDRPAHCPFTPAWYPYIATANIRLPAAEQISGTGGGGLRCRLWSRTRRSSTSNGFQAGLPEVFLQVIAGPTASSTSRPTSGGMATPNFTIDGLARDLGPMADTAKMLLGKFDPTTFFGTLEAKILGAISLADIIQAVTGADITDKAPKLNSAPDLPEQRQLQGADGLQTTLDWTPTVTGRPGQDLRTEGSTRTTR